MPVPTRPARCLAPAVDGRAAAVTRTLAYQRAASVTLHTGAPLLAPMRLMGVGAMISYTLDEGEHERRQAAGGTAVVSPDVLELLLGLPVGAPVPLAALSRRERGGLRAAPTWAVTVSEGTVTRWAVAPVSVQLALVGAQSWRSGLHLAGRFAPFCARAIVLGSPRGDEQELLMRADFYGIGVTVVRGERVDVLVEPAPYRRRRLTAAGWQFMERVYQHHR